MARTFWDRWQWELQKRKEAMQELRTGGQQRQPVHFLSDYKPIGTLKLLLRNFCLIFFIQMFRMRQGFSLLYAIHTCRMSLGYVQQLGLTALSLNFMELLIKQLHSVRN